MKVMVLRRLALAVGWGGGGLDVSAGGDLGLVDMTEFVDGSGLVCMLYCSACMGSCVI